MTTNTMELLDTVRHKNIKIKTSLIDVPHNHINTAIVVVGELATLVHEYPIYITKNPGTGQFQLSAIFGFEKGENLYLKKNAWQATYLPLDMLRRPFIVHMPEGDLSEGARLVLDTASPSLTKGKGERLFNDKGEATDYLQRIQKTFSQLMSGTKETNDILKKADEMGLIEPVSIDIQFNDKEATSLTGLYAINQKAVTELKGDALEQCHHSGILQVCHLLLSSGLHIEKLIKWKNSQKK
ncbi:SapC family protein [Colwellia sp. E2M01]|uniref:SapC family protein n=1 Tax=Colwellia sp. E2M01 TaxID=2841561 RepID=UPI001C092C7A|nr:SapC family protein [Colwellia sp. E2M01]MBU2872047.1 SapC family protein [Colwellia sp. E2M01]